MNSQITYGRLLARAVFILTVFGLVSLPQIRSENPAPAFAQMRDLISLIPIPLWFVIILILLAVLWAIMNIRYSSITNAIEQSPTERISISEVVKPEKGGNGLTSISYSPTLRLFNTLGWLEVKDPDKECIVIDGKHVIKNTRLFFAPMMLFGKPVNARRILLSPPPLVDVKATALTSDQLELTLVVSVKYFVENPVYVAKLSEPIPELNDLIAGVIVEQIHGKTLVDIVKDEGSLRINLKNKLNESSSIKSYFKIEEVLKAIPTGDERIIEIIRQTKQAIQRQALVEQEGINKELLADFDLAIKKKEAELQEEFIEKQHARDLELLHIQQEYEAIHELMRAIAQIAASGINPSPAIREIRSILSQTTPAPLPSLPESVPETLDLFHQEQKNLESIQEKIGFESFEIQPLEGKTDHPGSVVIQFDDFKLKIDCSAGYPSAAPQVFLHKNNDEISNITIPWFVGSNLIDVITTAVMQTRVKSKKKK
jgi:hypothetical protein